MVREPGAPNSALVLPMCPGPSICQARWLATSSQRPSSDSQAMLLRLVLLEARPGPYSPWMPRVSAASSPPAWGSCCVCLLTLEGELGPNETQEVMAWNPKAAALGSTGLHHPRHVGPQRLGALRSAACLPGTHLCLDLGQGLYPDHLT